MSRQGNTRGMAANMSPTVRAIWNLDPEWAMKRLEKRPRTTNKDHCWLAIGTNRYLDLRDTLRPEPARMTELVGKQVRLTYLAVVAKGHGTHLLNTRIDRRETREVMHQCHQPRCFNPEHVIVKTKILPDRVAPRKTRARPVRRTPTQVRNRIGSEPRMQTHRQTRIQTRSQNRSQTRKGLGNATRSVTTAPVSDLPADWVMEKLHKKTRTTNTTDCWLTGHTGEYPRMNLRNTSRPEEDRRTEVIGRCVKMHQLAIIAKGNGSQLLDTGVAKSKEVSHLCHHTNCFNPGHVIVESKALNRRRQTCNSVVYGETVYECSHGMEESKQSCILP